jgi:hypothetical protein
MWRGEKYLTLQQLRRATNASIQAQGLTRFARHDLLTHVAERIRITQHRNAKARQSHRRERIRQLHTLGTTLKNCRRCIPPDP